MKRKIVFVLILISNVVIALGFDNQPQKKNEFKLGIGDCPVVYGWAFEDQITVLNLTYERFVFDYLSLGGYCGIGDYDEWIHQADENSASTGLNRGHLKSPNFGGSVGLYVLPMIFKKSPSWCDIYFLGKIGGMYLPSSTEPGSPYKEEGFIVVPARGTYLKANVVAGVKLYPTKHIGLFAEYGYLKWNYYKGANLCYGLTYRF